MRPTYLVGAEPESMNNFSRTRDQREQPHNLTIDGILSTAAFGDPASSYFAQGTWSGGVYWGFEENYRLEVVAVGLKCGATIAP